MEAHAASRPVAPRAGLRLPGVGAGLGRGMVVLYLSVIVLLPLAALVDKSLSKGPATFWDQVSQGQAVRSLEITLGASLLVVAINATVGQKVRAGEALAVVEAMKMENVLRAERDLTVAKINVKQGDSLAVDAVIMEFE